MATDVHSQVGGGHRGQRLLSLAPFLHRARQRQGFRGAAAPRSRRDDLRKERRGVPEGGVQHGLGLVRPLLAEGEGGAHRFFVALFRVVEEVPRAADDGQREEFADGSVDTRGVGPLLAGERRRLQVIAVGQRKATRAVGLTNMLAVQSEKMGMNCLREGK